MIDAPERPAQRFEGAVGTVTRVRLRIGNSFVFTDETEVVIDRLGVTVYKDLSQSWWPHDVVESVSIEPVNAR